MVVVTIGDKTFKCKSYPSKLQVKSLPYKFVLDGKITPEDWARNSRTCADYFGLDMKEVWIDGRCKCVKKLEWFSISKAI